MKKLTMYRERLLPLFLATVLAVTLFPGLSLSQPDAAHAATTYSYTVKHEVADAGSFSDVPTSKFAVKGLGVNGLCCQSETSSKSGSAPATKLANTSQLAKAAYYYGYKKGWDKTASENRVKLARILSR
ncbi:MAG: hypothetical protein HUJ76_12240, partial [Parasporobacterium sp.]|nr:hypothetical protein [Parasporobacterium sp.]